MRAFRGPFAAVSTSSFLRTFRFCDASRDLLDSVSFFSLFSFLFSIHRGRTWQLYRFCPFFFVLWPLSAKVLKRASRATASVSFLFRTPLALSRNFLKFLIYLCPTRVNFSTASSTTFPHQVEGAALLLGRLPPPFPFLVFPFRPGIPGLFGALLQPPAPEKKKLNRKLNGSPCISGIIMLKFN